MPGSLPQVITLFDDLLQCCIRRRVVYGFVLMLHVNTAFAVRIYQGQRMVLGQSSDGPLLREMQVSNSTIMRNSSFIYSYHKNHEEAHLAGISQAAHRHRADASVLLPVWSAAALALGVLIWPHCSFPISDRIYQAWDPRCWAERQRWPVRRP